jgi:DEAD/DEAH box helicase domain-containing protein
MSVSASRVGSRFAPVNAVGDYVRSMLGTSEYARQVTFHHVEEGRDACLGESLRPMARPVMDASGMDGLYTHQILATDAVRSGRDVVVATPTASGKSMVYNLPVLEAYSRDPEIRALYVFPLKALARDQCQSFNAMGQRLHEANPRLAPPEAAIYDGDVTPHFRRKIREHLPTVLVTNPEMLHLAILPYHQKWTRFLAGLSFIVLDEAHTYRGVLGCHMAGVLRRLERICNLYNARPVRVMCTATVGNPGELGRDLMGLDAPPVVVSESGAPRGKRHFLFVDPELSPSSMAIRLLQAALPRQMRTIVYCRSRRMTELISMWASEKAGPYRSRISSYRAGFLPEERREIEARMASGALLAVISTSALELGIDIGNLDLCILVGYPGTIVSTLQRGGRVGRKGQESAVILVAGEDALDQFFVNNPRELFLRQPEKAVVNPANEVVLARHLECAADESPIRIHEAWLGMPGCMELVRRLEDDGTLLRTAEGDAWVAARRQPQRDVELRGSGERFQIEDANGTVIGSVDANQAFRETHPGAVYLHRGRSYTIRELDIGAKRVKAVEEKVRWHTRIRANKSTEILELLEEGTVRGVPAGFGRLRVTELITGYERRNNGTMVLIDVLPLDLPPQTFETEGLWIVVPDALRLATENKLLHFMGSIHALEHVSIGLMPLLVMADRNDFGGISTPMHSQVGNAAVFIYDGMPGGAGLTRAAFSMLPDLVKAVRDTLRSCPCEAGCPSCTHSPKCGSGNRPIDKAGALFLAEAIHDGPPPPKTMRCCIPERLGGSEPGRKSPAPAPKDGPKDAPKAESGAPDATRIETPGTPVEALPPHQKLPEPEGTVMVLDVETRRSAKEVGGWHRADRMGVSVAVLWDGERHCSFRQEELPEMFKKLGEAGLVVGFNTLRFDYNVLQPFTSMDLRSLPSLDMLVAVRKRLAYPVSLGNLATATLGVPKSADGTKALQWWKEGRIEEIAAYCQVDVELTRRLYEFGHENGHLLFTNKAGAKVRVPVSW